MLEVYLVWTETEPRVKKNENSYAYVIRRPDFSIGVYIINTTHNI